MKEWIYKIFSFLPKDKALHLTCSLGIAFIMSIFSFCIGMNMWYSCFTGFAISLGVGLGKEYGDKVNPNNFWDWFDVYADIAGCFIGTLIALLIMLLF